MCQNCKPQTEIVETVESDEQVIVPFEYHEEVKTYVTGGDTIHDNTLAKIRRCLSHWRILAGEKCPELPPLETLERFVEVWEGGTDYDDTRHIQSCLIPGFHSEFYADSIQPGTTPVSGDTEEKRKANRKALAKKWYRFISDCYGSERISGVEIRLSPVIDAVNALENRVKVNGQTYAKRLSKALHNLGWKLTKQQIETINNLADSGITPAESHNVAFDNDYLDGSASEYGNGRSCWWQDGDYGHSRHTFHNDGGYACRTFTDSGSVSGRVWIVPTPQGHLLFNAYLKRLDTFALMLSSAWNCDLLEVSIRHRYDLYINGASGYLIGDKAKFPGDACVEYYPEFVENEDIGGITCYHCSDRISEDDSCSDPNGNCLCESCFDARYSYCSRCSETFDRDELYECGDNHYCESCAESRGWVRCNDCDEWHDDRSVTSDGESVCSDCLDNYTCCEGCSKYYPSDECEISPNDDCQYCCDCIPEPEGEQYCQATGEVIDTDDIDSGHWDTSAVSSRSHCPGLIGFENGEPVQAYPVQHMLDIVNRDGMDCMFRPSRELACTVLMLCLAGF